MVEPMPLAMRPAPLSQARIFHQAATALGAETERSQQMEGGCFISAYRACWPLAAYSGPGSSRHPWAWASFPPKLRLWLSVQPGAQDPLSFASIRSPGEISEPCCFSL